MMQAHFLRRLPRLPIVSREDVTPDVIRQIVRFDSDTGKYFFTERPREFFKTQRGHRTFNSTHAGKEMFLKASTNGYQCVSLFNMRFSAHRVIWALHYGVWPSDFIDHINGDRSDNRLENLREASFLDNARNKGLSVRNKTGRVGVQWRKKRNNWRSSIEINHKEIHLGTFATFAEAVAAREAAEQLYGFHPNNGQERKRYARTSR